MKILTKFRKILKIMKILMSGFSGFFLKNHENPENHDSANLCYNPFLAVQWLYAYRRTKKKNLDL